MSKRMVEAVMSASSWSALVATGLVEDSDRGLRKALRQVHPDMESDPRAGEAFQKVRELHEGTYKPKGTLLGGKGYGFERLDDGRFVQTYAYPGDSDLCMTAMSVMRDLSRTDQPAFFPRVKKRYRDTRAGRIGVEIEAEGGDWWLLSDFKKLHPRDVVWIGKRLFAALILAHRENWMHGDIHADAVMVNPADHGVVLMGWGSAVRAGEKRTVRPVHYDSQRTGRESSDVYAVAQTLLGVGETSPRVGSRLKEFLLGGWGAQDAFNALDEAAREDFGAPRFHEMSTDGAGQPLSVR